MPRQRTTIDQHQERSRAGIAVSHSFAHRPSGPVSRLTALCPSVGAAPGVAVGDGTLAATQAADLFAPEDGLRLAAAPDNPGAGPDGIAIGSPSLTLPDSASGREVDPDEMRDGAHWPPCGARGSESPGDCVEALAASAVEAAPDAALGAVLPGGVAGDGAAPAVLSSFGPAPDNGTSPEVGVEHLPRGRGRQGP